MTGPRFGTIAISVLALLSAAASLAVLGVRTWPFTSWSLLAFAAWIALPAWLCHVVAPLALARDVLGPVFATLAPLALVGGCVAIGLAAWRRPDAPLPIAFVVAPAVQLAVAIPFLLFTSTDKPEESCPSGESQES